MVVISDSSYIDGKLLCDTHVCKEPRVTLPANVSVCVPDVRRVAEAHRRMSLVYQERVAGDSGAA